MKSTSVNVEIAARTDQGRVRPNNEDAYLVYRTGRVLERLDSSIPESELPSGISGGGYVMAVADGMGGAAAGEMASRNALTEAFRLVLQAPKWLLQLDDPTTREAEIQAFFDRAKAYIAGMQAALSRAVAADPSKAGMGTTLTCAYSVGWDLFVVHVGDSRVYLLRGGRIRRVTHDHTLAQNLADAGMIAQEEVAHHPRRNVLTRVIGGSGGWLRGETHHVLLEPGDRLVVCTDGLNAVLDDEEIGTVLRGEPDARRACDALIGRALDGGAPDNVTVVVARYTVAKTAAELSNNRQNR